MRNIKFIFNKIIPVIIILISLALFFNSCEDPPKSDAKDLKSLVVIGISGNSLTAIINDSSVTFRKKAALGTTSVTIGSISVSDKATVNKNARDVLSLDMTDTIIRTEIQVTAEDGTHKNYSMSLFVIQPPPPPPTLAVLTNLVVTNIRANDIMVSTTYKAGNNNTTRYGFVYSSSVSGDHLELTTNGIENKRISGAPTENNFSATLSNLTINTRYYIKAYAENSAGIAYSNEMTFMTERPILPGLGNLGNINGENLTAVKAIINVPITDSGNLSVGHLGIIYSKILSGTDLTLEIETSSGSTISGSWNSSQPYQDITVFELSANTLYYARAFIQTNYGTQYSPNSINFMTEELNSPSTSILESLNITDNSFDVIANYRAGNSYTIKYGLIYTSMAQGDFVIGDQGVFKIQYSDVRFSFNRRFSIDNLNAETTYRVKSFVTNLTLETIYSQSRTFTTLEPFTFVFHPFGYSRLSHNSATIMATLTTNRGIGTDGHIISCGLEYSESNTFVNSQILNRNFSDSNFRTSRNVQFSISLLNPNTTYYFRLFIIDREGNTSYFNRTSSFETPAPPPPPTIYKNISISTSFFQSGSCDRNRGVTYFYITNSSNELLQSVPNTNSFVLKTPDSNNYSHRYVNNIVGTRNVCISLKGRYNINGDQNLIPHQIRIVHYVNSTTSQTRTININNENVTSTVYRSYDIQTDLFGNIRGCIWRTHLTTSAQTCQRIGNN